MHAAVCPRNQHCTQIINRMTFDFVIETPDRRGINRNNNRIIQKRATIHGAKTRLGNKLSAKSPDPDTSKRRRSVQSKSNSPAFEVLLSNNNLAINFNSPFLARYGDHGQVLYAQDDGTDATSTCFRFHNTSMSVLQRHLLGTPHVQPNNYDMNKMFKVMTLTQRDFLLHLPSYYGYLGFLDDAIDCVVARIHDTVSIFDRYHYSAIVGTIDPDLLYSKALKSLRDAISDNVQENLPYVWFAVMLLTLFALLSNEDVFGWLWHVGGSTRILYMVGPESINTDFLMSLLSSQCRIMVIEAIFTNKPCYLAEPAWSDALRRCVLEQSDFSDRSEVNIELSIISTRVPDMFQAVSDLVHHEQHAGIKSIKREIEDLHGDLRNWSRQWRYMLESTCRDESSESTPRHQAFIILLTYYMLSAMVCRLHIAVDPFDSLDIESETVNSCLGVLSLRRYAMKCDTPSHFRGSTYCRTTAGTHATSNSWKRVIDLASPGDIVDAYLFDQWCSMIGREPHGAGGDILSVHAEDLAKRRPPDTLTST